MKHKEFCQVMEKLQIGFEKHIFPIVAEKAYEEEVFSTLEEFKEKSMLDSFARILSHKKAICIAVTWGNNNLNLSYNIGEGYAENLDCRQSIEETFTVTKAYKNIDLQKIYQYALFRCNYKTSTQSTGPNHQKYYSFTEFFGLIKLLNFELKVEENNQGKRDFRDYYFKNLARGEELLQKLEKDFLLFAVKKNSDLKQSDEKIIYIAATINNIIDNLTEERIKYNEWGDEYLDLDSKIQLLEQYREAEIYSIIDRKSGPEQVEFYQLVSDCQEEIKEDSAKIEDGVYSNAIDTFNRIRKDLSKLDKYFFEHDQEKNIEINLLENQSNIHAELVQVKHFIQAQALENLSYIGISKLCCPLCYFTIDIIKDHYAIEGILVRGTHKVYFIKNWNYKAVSEEIFNIIQCEQVVSGVFSRVGEALGSEEMASASELAEKKLYDVGDYWREKLIECIKDHHPFKHIIFEAIESNYCLESRCESPYFYEGGASRGLSI